jgi:chemotaxis protein MotB
MLISYMHTPALSKKRPRGLRFPCTSDKFARMKKTLLLVCGALAATVGCVSSGKYDSLSQRYKECQDQQGTCTAERAQLEKQVSDLTLERDSERAGRGELEGTMTATRKELEELRRQNAEAQKRLAAFRTLTARFQKMIDSGKLKVGFRKGLMIVELPAGILFASGRADLSKEGQAALTEVAGVLAELKDRRFLITGHTDNVPLRTARFKDNWDLSVARALVVSRWLMEQGVAPQQIGAAGYAEFDPVKDNDTEEGKQENRRIEIVLMPNIEELPRMPELTSN